MSIALCGGDNALVVQSVERASPQKGGASGNLMVGRTPVLT